MTPADHYAKAVELIDTANTLQSDNGPGCGSEEVLAEAQVHATLATIGHPANDQDTMRKRAERAERDCAILEDRAETAERNEGAYGAEAARLREQVGTLTDDLDVWKLRATGVKEKLDAAEAQRRLWADRTDKAEAERDEARSDARTFSENASKFRSLAEEYHARAEQAEAERDGWKSIAESNARYAEKADQECHDWRRRAERNAAEAARYYRKLRGIECGHGYRMTDSCPNCDAVEDRADPRCQDCGATNREECCATRGTGDTVEDIEQ